jgi:hypothetical protein
MAGVDEVIKRGYIDDKTGVTGGSGGGLLTNWVVGHTTRLRGGSSAARFIASWAHWWYGGLHLVSRRPGSKGPPFDQEEDFKARCQSLISRM